MAAALDAAIVWHGVRPDLACHGPEQVVAAFVTAYDPNQEIDSLEVVGGERHIVLGMRTPDLAIDEVETGGEIYTERQRGAPSPHRGHRRRGGNRPPAPRLQ